MTEISAEDRQAMGNALRKASKGPAGAVIRQVEASEADRAFTDDAGSIPPGEGRAGKAPGGRGSTAGISLMSPGGKNVQTEPDSRARENLAERQRRQGGRVTAVPAARPTIAAQSIPPAQSAALEDWERPAPPAPGDLLEEARIRALRVLGALPDGTELFVGGSGLGQDGISLVMGLGLLIGKGQAAYRGDGHYRLTDAGKAVFMEEHLQPW